MSPLVRMGWGLIWDCTDSQDYMSSVLLIEDNADLRLMLEQTLASAGYEVKTAEDGSRAIALFQNNPPDVVVTDIYMPNRDGLEVIMEIRASFPQTKIIAISGQITHKNMLPVAKTLGALRTLAKPFQPQQLLSAVQEVLQPPSAPGD